MGGGSSPAEHQERAAPVALLAAHRDRAEDRAEFTSGGGVLGRPRLLGPAGARAHWTPRPEALGEATARLSHGRLPFPRAVPWPVEPRGSQAQGRAASRRSRGHTGAPAWLYDGEVGTRLSARLRGPTGLLPASRATAGAPRLAREKGRKRGWREKREGITMGGRRRTAWV
jgi:hypothetical protein